LAKRLTKFTSGGYTVKVWVSLNESASLVAWPAEVAFASGARVDGAFLDAGIPLPLKKVESPLELFLQFVEASGEIIYQ